MNREIKFRAWDIMDQRMIVHEQEFIPVKVTSLGVLRLNPHHEESFWEFADPGRFILMQYTGLKDINGKEIYEGDLFMNGESIRIIDFIDGNFHAIKPDGTASILLSFIYKNGNNKVVGNKYENPDLILSHYEKP